MSGFITGRGQGSTVESALKTSALVVPNLGAEIDPQLSTLLAAPFTTYRASLFLVATCDGTLDTDFLNLGVLIFPTSPAPPDTFTFCLAYYSDYVAGAIPAITAASAGVGAFTGIVVPVAGSGADNIFHLDYTVYVGSQPATGPISVEFAVTTGGPTDATAVTILPGTNLTLTRLS